ncbi:unnamed protein product [Ectocarpus sp. 12 AP-2014]
MHLLSPKNPTTSLSYSSRQHPPPVTNACPAIQVRTSCAAGGDRCPLLPAIHQAS